MGRKNDRKEVLLFVSTTDEVLLLVVVGGGGSSSRSEKEKEVWWSLRTAPKVSPPTRTDVRFSKEFPSFPSCQLGICLFRRRLLSLCVYRGCC